jgi:hypothetical protein
VTLDPAFGLLLFVPIAIVAVAAVVVARPSRRAIAAISVCGVLGFIVGCGGPKDRSADTSQAAATPSAVSAASAAPAAPVAAARMSTFTAADLSAAKQAKASGLVAVDVLDVRANGAHHEALTLAPNQTLNVIGWAYDEPRNAPCVAVGLMVDGKRIYPALYGYARPDVAAFYKDPMRTNVGYSLALPAAKLSRGDHVATVVCVAPASAATRYSGQLQIAVR